MEAILELTLAALLALSADFHDGLELLQKGRPQEAAAKLERVVQAKPNVPALREYALYHLADALSANRQPAKAKEALGVLLRTGEDAELRKKAAARFAKLGGDFKALRPKESPRQVMNKFLAAVTAGKEKEAKTYLSGPLLDLLETVDQVFTKEEGNTFLAEIGDEMDEFQFVSESFDDESMTATLTATMHGDFTFRLVQKDYKWVFDSLVGYASRRRRGPHRVAARQAMAAGLLSQLGKALVMYSMDHEGKFAPKLDALGEYLGDAQLQWKDPATGKQRDFIYRSGLTTASAPDTMMAATPGAADGKRSVLFLDGHVELIGEDTFKERALKQQWKLPSMLTKEDVPAEVGVEVKALIAVLGEGDFRDRKAAKQRLAEIGSDAFPFLEEHREHPDPEVKMTVLELLAK